MKPTSLEIQVKFRAAGITFGTVRRSVFFEDLPIIAALVVDKLRDLPSGMVLYDDRGVRLTVV